MHTTLEAGKAGVENFTVHTFTCARAAAKSGPQQTNPRSHAFQAC